MTSRLAYAMGRTLFLPRFLGRATDGMTSTAVEQIRRDEENQAVRFAEAVVGAMRPFFDEAMIEEMCRGHDREDAAQKGEPSPWEIAVDGDDFHSFRKERIVAMREALKAVGLA